MTQCQETDEWGSGWVGFLEEVASSRDLRSDGNYWLEIKVRKGKRHEQQPLLVVRYREQTEHERVLGTLKERSAVLWVADLFP